MVMANWKAAHGSARAKRTTKWQRNEVLAAPPVLHALKTLAGGLTNDLVERFLSVPEAHRQPTRGIEFRPNYICFPVRTPTKPPATHTNCYLIYTSREFWSSIPARLMKMSNTRWLTRSTI